MLTPATRDTILSHFASLDFWEGHWPRAAVTAAGSAAVGWEDEFSDTDVLVFVPQEEWEAIYERHWQAVTEGRVSVMNPRAREHHEFPYSYIPGTNAHYMLYVFEEAEEKLARYDDVAMWVHGNSIVLHDPSGRYARLRAATSYPEEVWRAKRRELYIGMANAGGAASNPLRRGDRAAVMLTLTDAVMHALRLCCLLEREPFPYEKWLLRAAAETEPGRAVLPLIEELLEELRRPEIRRVEVTTRSDHRSADLEEYPLYSLWRKVRARLEEWAKRPSPQMNPPEAGKHG
jgi:hypothetical protein